MGYGKQKRKILDSVDGWGCFGFYGYGQGRAVAQFGEDILRGKSVCLDLCKKREECRSRHLIKMDTKYPLLGKLVRNAVKASRARSRDVAKDVVLVLNEALGEGLSEAVDIQQKLKKYKVTYMTDHYRCGQFENIDDGFGERSPGDAGR